MKKIQILKSRGVAMAALLMASSSLVFAQTSNVTINAFASGSEGDTPSGCGSEWGDGTIEWDNEAATPYPGTEGSAYISANFLNNDGSGYPVNEYVCYPGDNWYYYNTNGPAAVDLSQYSAIQFQILWDTNDSTISIDQFNNPATYPLASYGANSDAGLQVGWIVGNSGNGGFIGDFNIPDAASNGWTTMTIPIPDNLNNTAGTVGIVLGKWVDNESATGPAPIAYFWVGNVQLLGTAAPPPPPTLSAPTKPTSGLNIFASTDGNTYYDRQEVGLVASNGVSWVGNDLASSVTYSFTINGFPQSPATEAGYISSTVTNGGGCEAYLMMAPNPAAYDNAIDWNEPNCVVISLQQNVSGSTIMDFQFKTNEPGGNSQYGPNTIGTVTNNGTALGTWSITFTSDTNVTMTAPDGNTSSFVFPAAAASAFAEANDPGMYLYLGMQANNAASLNQAVCYSQFSVSGVPAAVTDNFLTDSTLNTNVWFNFMATGAGGVFVMPPGAKNWISWTLPDAGFQLQAATSLTGLWSTLTDDHILGGIGQVSQLITTNDVPAGTPDAFFKLANP
jgi:hypothetical protein